MKRPKIVIDADIPFIRGRLEPWADTLYVDQFGFTPENVADADAMIIRTRTRCNRDLLEGSAVKLIATATIGMDQFDLDWCRGAGIECVNAPGCNAPGVAQYVWSVLLRSGFDPKRMTLGVVGHGNVGSIVADWGRRLGARVLVSDPPKRDAGTLGCDDTPLDTILKEADAVTLHVPMTRAGEYPTHHLIGERELALMRPGARLVNAARGPVVDNAAWRKAVAEGRVRAFVDTWEGEPDLDRELLRLAEVATFHIAGYSTEGKQRATRMALEAVGRRFGWDIDLSGLAGAYVCPGLTERKIIAFDTLRRDYVFRPEVK